MTQIHHVSLLTKNAAENVRFYTQVLGFRFVKNTVNQENIHMRHLFFGDYQGTPGTVTTFFEIPNIGHRYDGKNYLNGIHYGIPQGSLDFWQQRLQSFSIDVYSKNDQLQFNDPDGVNLTFQPISEILSQSQVVSNDIPAKFQIVRIIGTEMHVAEPKASIDFFQHFLNLPLENNKLQLAAGNFIQVVPSNSETKHRFGRGSMDHFALTVDNDKVLDDLVAKARSQDWYIEEVANRGWFRSLYIREPNHNRIEFATMQPGFTLDEPLTKLGQSLGLTPEFEDKRFEIENYFAQRSVKFNGK